jgi:hypothetical protein
MVRGVVAVLVVAATATPAAASPIRLEVSGDACSLASLETQLTALAGTDPVDAAAAAGVRVEVTKPAHGYQAQIFFDDGDGAIRGPRVVEAKSCGELLQSVALVVVMALPDRPQASSAPAPVEEPKQPGPAPVEEQAHAEPAPVAEPKQVELVPASPPVAPPAVGRETTIVASVEPSRGASGPANLGVFAAGGGGISTHGFASQLILGARIERGRVSLAAEVRADAPEQLVVAQMASVRVLRSQLSLAPCVHAGAFAGCVVASAGAFHGSADGLASERSVYSPLLSTGARVIWEHPVTERVALRVHAGIDALVTTTSFDVDHMRVWVSPRFEGSAGVGVLAHFP